MAWTMPLDELLEELELLDELLEELDEELDEELEEDALEDEPPPPPQALKARQPATKVLLHNRDCLFIVDTFVFSNSYICCLSSAADKQQRVATEITEGARWRSQN